MTVDSAYMSLNYVAQCKLTRHNRSAHASICPTHAIAAIHVPLRAVNMSGPTRWETEAQAESLKLYKPNGVSRWLPPRVSCVPDGERVLRSKSLARPTRGYDFQGQHGDGGFWYSRPPTTVTSPAPARDYDTQVTAAQCPQLPP